MKRLKRFVFHGLAVVALGLAFGPYLWHLITRDSHPRTRFAGWFMVLHVDGELVIRSPGGSQWHLNQNVISAAALAYLGIWVAVPVLRCRRERARARVERARAEGRIICRACGYTYPNTEPYCPDCRTIS